MVRSVPNEILNINKPEGRREIREQTEWWLDAVDESRGYWLKEKKYRASCGPGKQGYNKVVRPEISMKMRK
jgi:hypothetical protein